MNELSSQLLLWGVCIHLVCDWVLQNHWMAVNKTSLKHPASWVHAGIHVIGMLLIFKWPFALLIGFIHMLIDTRVPIVWWKSIYKQTSEGEVSTHLNIWMDQVFHIMTIMGVALWVGTL